MPNFINPDANENHPYTPEEKHAIQKSEEQRMIDEQIAKVKATWKQREIEMAKQKRIQQLQAQMRQQQGL